MRIRTGTVTMKKAAGLETFFELANDRHLAWVVGNGHAYSDLERVAKRNGYRVFVPEKDQPDYWFAVRADLVSENSWEPAKTQVKFVPRRESLGQVTLNDDPDFNLGDRITSDAHLDPEENDLFSYGERQLSVKSL